MPEKTLSSMFTSIFNRSRKHKFYPLRAPRLSPLFCSSFNCVPIKIIITLFKSQFILAEHECSTNWGDCKRNKSNTSNQIKCWFLRRGENRRSGRKTSWSWVENQQTQLTYDAGSGNRTRDTLVKGERSHHCAIITLLQRHFFTVKFISCNC